VARPTYSDRTVAVHAGELIVLGWPKCYEPAETAAMSLSYKVPDLRKRRRIPIRHASVFGMNDEPGVCTRMKHPMTKSDANVKRRVP
jgi:hypothetical protein